MGAGLVGAGPARERGEAPAGSQRPLLLRPFQTSLESRRPALPAFREQARSHSPLAPARLAEAAVGFDHAAGEAVSYTHLTLPTILLV